MKVQRKSLCLSLLVSSTFEENSWKSERDRRFEEIMEWVCQAPRGTLAPGTASPPRTAPPSLANSGNEESGIEVSESNNEDA